MMFRLCRADHSRFHQPSHIGVVAGYARNLAIADQVEPRVANMDVVESFIVRSSNDRRRGASRAHASQFRMGKTVLPDLLVRGLQGLNQGCLGIVAAKVAIDGHHGFHGQAAGLLTAFVAAHAVCHYGESPLTEKLLVVLGFPITKGVFIIIAETTDVGLARYLNPGANLHPATTSVRGITSIGNIGTGKPWII